MHLRKITFVIIFLVVVSSTCWQGLVLNFISNQTSTFSTSYIHITNSDNKLTIDPGSVRGQIFSVIEQNPGIYFRGICQETGKEIGVVQYHVQVLMAFKNISQFQDGRYARYFINNSTLYDECGKLLVSAWNRPLDKEILSELYNNDKKKHCINQLANNLGVSRQAISSHVNKLKAQGLLEFTSSDGYVAKSISLTSLARMKLDFLSTRDIIKFTM